MSIPSYEPGSYQPEANGEPLWFMFYKNRIALLAGADGNLRLPHGEQPLASAFPPRLAGDYHGQPCRALLLDSEPGPDYQLTDYRQDTYELLGEELYALGNSAKQLCHWELHSQFCGICGARTLPATPVSKKCPGCGNEIFPPLSVAILAVVTKGESILLVRSHNITGLYHVLVSGFAEPGETLEQCVYREVLEETGLKVGNIRYFGSQSWAHPSNLMVGFFADYQSGEIEVQQEELQSAAFFDRPNLPELPHRFSIARRMADWWVECQDKAFAASGKYIDGSQITMPAGSGGHPYGAGGHPHSAAPKPGAAKT
ncbi:NAD(+) diphosphatase [Desulfovibrio sp. OttesenSCG-928-C06]|nr:NAD(+) diphosphatase [Desulfovibrio sp. OttesenSCG-928-C06]